jgi:hypothetical protein
MRDTLQVAGQLLSFRHPDLIPALGDEEEADPG